MTDPARVDYQTEPSRYRHWKLSFEGATATLAMDTAEDGGLRRFVNVYVSGEDIRFSEGLDTQLSDGDEVTILPAVAGG